MIYSTSLNKNNVIILSFKDKDENEYKVEGYDYIKDYLDRMVELEDTNYLKKKVITRAIGFIRGRRDFLFEI